MMTETRTPDFEGMIDTHLKEDNMVQEEVMKVGMVRILGDEEVTTERMTATVMETVVVVARTPTRLLEDRTIMIRAMVVVGAAVTGIRTDFQQFPIRMVPLLGMGVERIVLIHRRPLRDKGFHIREDILMATQACSARDVVRRVVWQRKDHG